MSVEGYTKLNFDGSESQEGAATAGYVLQDWKGSFITDGTRFVEQASIRAAETMALRDGMKAALEALNSIPPS